MNEQSVAADPDNLLERERKRVADAMSDATESPEKTAESPEKTDEPIPKRSYLDMEDKNLEKSSTQMRIELKEIASAETSKDGGKRRSRNRSRRRRSRRRSSRRRRGKRTHGRRH